MTSGPHFYLPRRRFLQGLTAAGLLSPLSRLGAEEAREKTVTVSVLHTTDLHGHIASAKTYDGVENTGGLARCVTQIRKWRAENPNHLLIDIGDVYQGTHVSRSTEGEIMLRLFNRLQYDAWVIGNHEFDWGVEKLVRNVELSQMPVLASNGMWGDFFVNQLSDKTEPMSKVAPYLLKEVAGFRIGIIGSVTPGLPSWLNERLLGDFTAAPPLKSVQYAIQKLQALKPDAIVLACHFGLKSYKNGVGRPDDFANRVHEITAACREIDAVIAGHTHQDIPGAEVNGILYTQAGYHGTRAGRLDLTFDRESRKLVAKTAQTVRMDSGIEPDAMVLSVCAGELESSARELAREVCEFTEPLPHKAANGQAPASLLLITRGIRHGLEQRGVKVDGVLHGLFIDNKDLPAGRKTIADMWEIIPYENRLVTAELTGEELRAALTEIQGGYFASHTLDGFRVTVEGSGREAKITTLALADGAPVEEGKRYRIAMNAYDAQSGGRRYPLLHEAVSRWEAKRTLHELETRDALMEFVSFKKRISPADLQAV